MDKDSLVSIILPVWNAEQFIASAIRSILVQTYKNFELILLDDGSSDGTAKQISAFHDTRIHYVRLPHRGLVATLNEGLRLSKGVYIARMDADDISMPLRIERQVAYMNQHHDCGLLGTAYCIMDQSARPFAVHPVLLDPQDIHVQLLYKNPLGHGSVMIRKYILEKHRLSYRAEANHFEDLDLWLRISKISEIANLEEPLYLWMEHDASLTGQNRTYMIEQARVAINKAYSKRETIDVILQTLPHLLHTNYPKASSVTIQNQRLQVFRRAEYQFHLLQLTKILYHYGVIIPASKLLIRSFLLAPMTYIKHIREIG